MIPTFIGVAVAAIGMYILARGTVLGMFAMMMACALMQGSAAFMLPALGGSSIPPVQFALGFMMLKLVVGEARPDLLWNAIARNAPLLVFVLYGVTMAIIGPRMFAGDMYVFPMKLLKSGFDARPSPLGFSPQNVTASIYMVGMLLLSITSCAAMLHPGGARRLVKTAAIVAMVHAFLGISGSLLVRTPWNDVLDLFRNGSYAQLDQNLGSFARMRGLAPESSSYSMAGFVWFVFVFECWLRDLMPRWTGPAAAAVGLALVFSTSSTAYLGLGGYAVVLLLRIVLVRGTASFRKLLVLGALALVAVAGCMALYVLMPAFALMFGDMIQLMTVGKTSSGSAMERAGWARQGLQAFQVSSGIGVGPGSFRSSSLVTALLGATGVVGTLAFLVHVLRVVKPLRPSTYVQLQDAEASVGVAASWAAFAILIPASMVLPGVDTGPEFAMLGGAALALRWKSSLSFASASKVPVPHGQEDRSLVAA